MTYTSGCFEVNYRIDVRQDLWFVTSSKTVVLEQAPNSMGRKGPGRPGVEFRAIRESRSCSMLFFCSTKFP